MYILRWPLSGHFERKRFSAKLCHHRSLKQVHELLRNPSSTFQSTAFICPPAKPETVVILSDAPCFPVPQGSTERFDPTFRSCHVRDIIILQAELSSVCLRLEDPSIRIPSGIAKVLDCDIKKVLENFPEKWAWRGRPSGHGCFSS